MTRLFLTVSNFWTSFDSFLKIFFLFFSLRANLQAIVSLKVGNVTVITIVSTTPTKKIVHPSPVPAHNSNVPI